MAKTCPSCGYTNIGPFVDNCPICAEPMRHVASEGLGRPLIGGMGSVVRWVLGGLAIAMLCVFGCCGLGMWRMSSMVEQAQKAALRAQADAAAERLARTEVVAVTELLREFVDDAAAADRKYAGKYLELSGLVERVGRGRHDAPFIILTGGEDMAKIKIECFFDGAGRKDQARIRRLDVGETITVRGEYDGQVSNVQVRDCVLVD